MYNKCCKSHWAELHVNGVALNGVTLNGVALNNLKRLLRAKKAISYAYSTIKAKYFSRAALNGVALKSFLKKKDLSTCFWNLT